jgi:hypothetical protein
LKRLSRRSGRLGLFLALLLFVALLALVSIGHGPRLPGPGGQASPPSLPLRFPPGTLPLRVGIHVKNLYNLQLESQTFSADGWYRLEWDPPLEALRRENGIAVARMVEFINQVETWDSEIEAETPEPVLESDGSRTQTFRFSARFYIDALDVHDSPFETIELPLILETRPEIFSLEQRAVQLIPARNQNRLVGEYGDVAGYVLRGARQVPSSNTYEPMGPGEDETHSQLAIRVLYGSDFQAGFIKWILPLLIVMGIVLLAPSLESSLGDLRLAIPSTALLTLVFLQQTYRAELPATPYPTFLDQLYAASYLVAVGLFVLFLWSSNQFEATPEEQRSAMRRRINRIDALCQWGALLGLMVWAGLAWIL